MQRIRSRLSQYADVRAAVVALSGVVLRGVDGDLLNGIRGRSGKSLANRPIYRCAGLDSTPRTDVLTGVEHESVLTWLAEFPLKMLFVLIPFKEKLLLVSRFPLAKMA